MALDQAFPGSSPGRTYQERAVRLLRSSESFVECIVDSHRDWASLADLHRAATSLAELLWLSTTVDAYFELRYDVDDEASILGRAAKSELEFTENSLIEAFEAAVRPRFPLDWAELDDALVPGHSFHAWQNVISTSRECRLCVENGRYEEALFHWSVLFWVTHGRSLIDSLEMLRSMITAKSRPN